jgi:hypothetical protein
MRRAIFVVCGLLLVASAFLAGAQVADTREGLIAEVVALFCGLAGVVSLLYGLIPRRRDIRPMPPRDSSAKRSVTRTANDLVLGGGGVVLAALLFAGLAYSGGWLWAALGGVLLLPMLAGSAYLLIGFARAPERDWTVDLPRLFRARADNR